LVRDGFDRASTNRIAEEAGVSIGSLYQYFPGKEALVVAVIERHNREIMQVARDAVVEAEGLPLEVAARGIIAAAIEAHRVDPDLHRVLAEQVPRVGRLEDIDAVERYARTFVRSYLEAHREEIDVADLDLAAFVLTTTVESLTHNAVLHRPEVLADGQAGAFVDEITGLLLRYLRAPALAR
jgi:AcrR family transcriptional regulator